LTYLNTFILESRLIVINLH